MGQEEAKSGEIEEIQIGPKSCAKMTFRFLYSPEYLVQGKKIIINEQNYKLIGHITKVFYDTYKHNAVNRQSRKKSSRAGTKQVVLEENEEEIINESGTRQRP